MTSITVISRNEGKKLIRDGLHIIYGFHTTPYGKCLIGVAKESMAVCHLSFIDSEEGEALQILAKEWPKANLIQANELTAGLVRVIFQKYSDPTRKPYLNVLVTGTDFQSQVWNTLLSVPEGSVTNYENVANMIGNPNSVRASANAIAKNKVAILIPCHRVISKSGHINSYRWGQKRKMDLLFSENPSLDLEMMLKKKKLA